MTQPVYLQLPVPPVFCAAFSPQVKPCFQSSGSTVLFLKFFVSRLLYNDINNPSPPGPSDSPRPDLYSLAAERDHSAFIQQTKSRALTVKTVLLFKNRDQRISELIFQTI